MRPPSSTPDSEKSHGGYSLRPAQSGMAKHLAGRSYALGLGRRARRPRRQPGAGLRDPGKHRSVFRLALVPHRLARNSQPASSPPAGAPQVTVPKVLLQAHSASLGSAFYTGTQFPPDARGGLFVGGARLGEPRIRSSVAPRQPSTGAACAAAWRGGREDPQKRYLVHVAGYDLGLVMPLLVGAGPKDPSCTTEAGFSQRAQ